jgi:DNA polymerase I
MEPTEQRASTYRLVADAEDLASVAETLRDAAFVGLDIETTDLSPRDGRLRLLQRRRRRRS